MTFTMSITTGDYTNTLVNPAIKIIESAIDALAPAQYHHIVLECDETVCGFRFIQTVILLGGDDKGKYCVEIQHELGETKFKDGTPFTQYELRTTDIEAVKQAFRASASGISPDISDWRNISNDMIEEFRERAKKNNTIIAKTQRFFNSILTKLSKMFHS